ncbi:hypothetical protein [uncultured Bdellovibrio sp.]|uniref:hypothetical protein n=1 Tax=Bdellovibrio sp. HCB-162 TaxID=3394234 RepID=UPI0025E63A1B|nr:hypothetical protein [uncultured Bdellovibrio sp.]
MKDKIQNASRNLKNLHRRFLELERIAAEKYFERRISPFDFLQILTHDKNFAWLQPFSALIAEIDAFVDESEHIVATDLTCIKDQIDFVLHKSEVNSKIYHRYQHHISEDPEFVMMHANLNEALSQLKP